MHEAYTVRNGALTLCDVRARLSASPRVHIPISDSDAEPASIHAPFCSMHAYMLYAYLLMLHRARLCCIVHAYVALRTPMLHCARLFLLSACLVNKTTPKVY
jgi:hypothetical protein